MREPPDKLRDLSPKPLLGLAFVLSHRRRSLGRARRIRLERTAGAMPTAVADPAARSE